VEPVDGDPHDRPPPLGQHGGEIVGESGLARAVGPVYGNQDTSVTARDGDAVSDERQR
jgi:hypothetical protein